MKLPPRSSRSPFLSLKWNREQQSLSERRQAKRSLNAAIVIQPHFPRSPRVPMATPGFGSPIPSRPSSCGPEAVRAGGLWEAAVSGGAASARDDEAAEGPEPEVSGARG